MSALNILVFILQLSEHDMFVFYVFCYLLSILRLLYGVWLLTPDTNPYV